MEALSPVGRSRWGWVANGVLLALLLSGPENVAKVVSFTTSLVTWPITRELRIEDNRFEIFNVELLLVYLIAVIGLNLLVQTGLISIGHSAPFAVGAYTVAILSTEHGVSVWLAIPLGGLAALVLGFVLGLPSLRLGIFTLAMVTVGYAFVVEDLLVEWRGLTGGGDGIRGIQMPAPLDDLQGYYWLVAGVAVVAYALSRNLIRSPFGRSGRSIEENPVAAQSLGINAYHVKLRAFALSSLFAGIAGGLYAPLLGFVAPDSFTANLAILLLLMVLFGGSGSVVGPVVGTVLLFRIPIEVERVTDQPGDWSLLVYGVVLVLSVFFFPRGVMSAWWWVRDRVRASRRGPEVPVAVPPALGDVITAAPARSGPAVDAARVRKTLGGVTALAGLDLVVQPGEVHALIGPNGSGKTTFLNVVSGFLAPDDGHVRLFGEDITSAKAHRRARMGLARTFQTPLVFEHMSCVDNVLAALDRHRRRSNAWYAFRLGGTRAEERRHHQRAMDLLGAVGLGDRAEDAAGDLPPGGRRLLELARVLALEPTVVLMDEPAAGLSITEIDELADVVRSLRRAGIAVLLVEHHFDLIERLADTVTVIDFGQVIARGAAAEVRVDPAVVAAYLGAAKEHVDELPPELLSVRPSGEGGT